MKTASLLLVILLVFIVPISMVSAQQPTTGTPAIGSPEDNACNVGGKMEGKCDSEWAWSCGWYLARYYSGLFTRQQVIATCQMLLPVPVAAPSTSSAAGFSPACFTHSVPGVQHDENFNGVPNSVNNVVGTISQNGTCSGGFNFNRTYVVASSMGDANGICVALGFGGSTGQSSNDGVPSNFWICS